jgi:hypothetical protein
MNNLDSITQELEEKIKSTLISLAIEATTKIVKKLRTRQVEGDIEINFCIKPFSKESVNNHESYFNHDLKAEVFYKKGNIILDFKKELKELYFFSHRFNQASLKIVFRENRVYSEESFIRSMYSALYHSNIQTEISPNLINQEILKLEALEEKAKIESQLDEVKSVKNKIKM